MNDSSASNFILPSLEWMDDVKAWVKSKAVSQLQLSNSFQLLPQSPVSLVGLSDWISIITPKLMEFGLLEFAENCLRRSEEEFRDRSTAESAVQVLGWQLFLGVQKGYKIDEILDALNTPKLAPLFDSFFRVQNVYEEGPRIYCVAMSECFREWEFTQRKLYLEQLTNILDKHGISNRSWESWLFGKSHNLSKYEYNFAHFISMNLREGQKNQKSQVRLQNATDPTTDDSRVPPPPQDNDPIRDESIVQEDLVHYSLRIPKPLRDWLIAKYLNDPLPDMLPINKQGNMGKGAAVAFSDLSDCFLRNRIDLCFLDKLVDAGFISDIRVDIGTQEGTPIEDLPYGIQRLQLPIGRHRLIVICDSILRSIAELEHDVSSTVSYSNDSKKLKSARRRGNSEQLLVASLLNHHRYSDRSVQNFEPISNKQLANLAGVSTATASRFFEDKFDGYPAYKSCCVVGSISNKLAILNRDVPVNQLKFRDDLGVD